MKNGDIVELIEDTYFYKKGRKAIVIDACGNSKKFKIQYVGEEYLSGDVDVMPKNMFKLSGNAIKDCSTCKNNVEYSPPHTCDICTSLDQEEEYEMWEEK